jgi:hypothetical protein
MSKEDHFIICYPVTLFPSTPSLASSVDLCLMCHQPVWRAHSSPREPKALCVDCAIVEIFEGDSDSKIMPPTPEQIRDITRHMQ